MTSSDRAYVASLAIFCGMIAIIVISVTVYEIEEIKKNCPTETQANNTGTG